MTLAAQRTWIRTGQAVIVATLFVLSLGAMANLAGQVMPEQVLAQATATATLSAEVRALADRIGKVEAQNNYVLMALVGSLIAQLVQLRTTGKR